MTNRREEDDHRRALLEAGARAAFGPESGSGPDDGRPRIRGTHRVLDEIARGGMGVILRGRDEDLGRDVAMKVLVEELAHDPAALRRFMEEAQIGGQLQHPGIVPIYEVGRMPDRRPYFTMKLVRGRTLSELLARRASPADDRHRFLSIFERVCQTIAYAHARGVVHRDLKPSNVMVGAFGEVQVVDWGLAKVLAGSEAPHEAPHETTDERPEASEPEPRVRTESSAAGDEGSRAGTVLGTPAYMAPEQASGRADAVDERADVFSLGAILCVLLTGAPPYEPERGDVLRQAAEARLEPARARLAASGADPELVDLCERCLAARPSDRPRSAEAVARALAAHLAAVDERARAAQIAAAEERVKARAERKLLAGSFVAVLVVAAAGVILYLQLSNAARGRRERLESSVGAALAEVAQLRGRAETSGRIADWREARRAGQDAVALLETGVVGASVAERARRVALEVDAAGAEAEARAERERSNAALLAALAEVRRPDGDRMYPTNWARVDADFATLFRDAGLDLDRLETDEATTLVRERGLGGELAPAIDEWAAARRAAGGDARALEVVAMEVDDDEARRQLREALSARDVDALLGWVATEGAATLPAPTAVLLGDALGQLGRRAEAVAVLRAAREEHPADVRVNQFLARWLGMLDPPNHEEAAGYLRAALSLRPDSLELRHELGECLVELGRFTQAEACIRQTLRRRPDDGHMVFHLGRALLLQDRFDEAVAACRESVRLAPDDAAAHANLGHALTQVGDPRGAVSALQEAIRLEPELAAAHHNLGAALLALGDWGRAEPACRAAVRLDPSDFRACYNLGVALQGQQRFAEAAEAFGAALEANPSYAKAHLELGRSLLFLEDLEAARAALHDAIDLDPTSAQAHYVLGHVLERSGDLEEAAEAYGEAARIRPGYLFKYALAREAVGDAEGALESLRAAVAHDPGSAEERCQLGRMLENAGRYEEAVEAYRLCHELGSRRADWDYASESWLQRAETGARHQRAVAEFERSGTAPETAHEARELAAFAFDRSPAASADLHGLAFELDPALASSPELLARAAIAAARAGDDTSRRTRAAAWLRAALDALDGCDAAMRERVVGELAEWRSSFDLASVDDLEPEERAIRSELRDDLARLLPEDDEERESR